MTPRVPKPNRLESMRRLNSIKDRLARRILALHRDCGSGHGPCDWDEDEAVSWSDRKGWGCETTALVASHFGIEYPEASAVPA